MDGSIAGHAGGAPRLAGRQSLARVIALTIGGTVAVAALAYVKWWPLWQKATAALATHRFQAASILTGGAAVAPAPSWQAAWGYAQAYYGAVWMAVIAGIIVGGAIQALVPPYVFQRFLAASTLKATLLATGSALPAFFCSCCAAPVGVGLRERRVALAPALAWGMAAPSLNVATIVFIGVALGWQLAALRVVLALLGVVGVSLLAARIARRQEAIVPVPLPTEPADAEVQQLGVAGWLGRWGAACTRLAIVLVPLYVVTVLLLGFARAWLFPLAGVAGWGNGLLPLALLALAGTLFVIPTAGEVPIVQALLTAGLTIGPATALLITLPIVSLPAMAMLRTAVPTRALVTMFVGIWLLGIFGGLLATAVL